MPTAEAPQRQLEAKAVPLPPRFYREDSDRQIGRQVNLDSCRLLIELERIFSSRSFASSKMSSPSSVRGPDRFLRFYMVGCLSKAAWSSYRIHDLENGGGVVEFIYVFGVI